MRRGPCRGCFNNGGCKNCNVFFTGGCFLAVQHQGDKNTDLRKTGVYCDKSILNFQLPMHLEPGCLVTESTVTGGLVC